MEYGGDDEGSREKGSSIVKDCKIPHSGISIPGFVRPGAIRRPRAYVRLQHSQRQKPRNVSWGSTENPYREGGRVPSSRAYFGPSQHHAGGGRCNKGASIS